MTVSWAVVVPACVAAALWTTQPSRVRRLTHVPERRPARDQHARAWRIWRTL
jgi:hypothetical protein